VSSHAHAATTDDSGEPKSPQYHVAHHFDSADVQFESNKLGIWLFLAQEVLFFSGLFCAFAIFKNKYFAAFVEAHHHLDWKLGSVNTLALLSSSLTMALAVRAAQRTKKNEGVVYLLLTLAFAATFMVIKYVEYSHKFHEGLLPGRHFTAHGFTHPEANIYFGIYFMMTGVHGLHVLIGMGLILWITIRMKQGYYSSRYYAPVEGVGLYWHLVDLIWIYLFPLLYLVG
jgi:cytochrome c oxidase subunit 3